MPLSLREIYIIIMILEGEKNRYTLEEKERE
jgi:hypothetical protein